MDKLVSLYERMKKLREAGVRMKDISEETGIASSVLSSLYSSVLPTYINLLSGGCGTESALDQGLQQVNNVSKRKLQGCLDELYDKVSHIEPRFVSNKNGGRPFLDDIEKEAIKYLPNAGIYTGLYQSYSSSSYSDGLKVEPYMISSIVDGDTMPKVYCQNLSGDYYIGVGLFSPFQIGYLMFNEQKRLQLALKVVYLQLPIIEYPQIMKGIYLTHDYNRNPIARRILFVRQGDEIPLEEFADLRTEVIPKAQLTGELLEYYNYTCCNEDIIRSMMLISPDKDTKELQREKQLLKILSTQETPRRKVTRHAKGRRRTYPSAAFRIKPYFHSSVRRIAKPPPRAISNVSFVFRSTFIVSQAYVVGWSPDSGLSLKTTAR